MTLTFVGKHSVPAYIALETDIEDNDTIPGAFLIGKTVFLTDIQEYRLILPDLKLIPFAYANGISGVAPTYVSSEVGSVADTTVVVTFSENILAPDYKLGVIIKVNGISRTISSGTRQATHSIVRYVLAVPVVALDVVTWEYSELIGGIHSETGTVFLADVSPQVVTNNT